MNKLYCVKEMKAENGTFTAVVRIDPAADVFKGHFPGNPIMPGVCMIQMIKELLSDHAGRDLSLKTASNIKFLAMLNPEIDPEVTVTVAVTKNEQGIPANAKITAGDKVFISLKGVFA